MSRTIFFQLKNEKYVTGGERARIRFRQSILHLCLELSQRAGLYYTPVQPAASTSPSPTSSSSVWYGMEGGMFKKKNGGGSVRESAGRQCRARSSPADAELTRTATVTAGSMELAVDSNEKPVRMHACDAMTGNKGHDQSRAPGWLSLLIGDDNEHSSA